jgi:hypothetical protein
MKSLLMRKVWAVLLLIAILQQEANACRFASLLAGDTGSGDAHAVAKQQMSPQPESSAFRNLPTLQLSLYMPCLYIKQTIKWTE